MIPIRCPMQNRQFTRQAIKIFPATLLSQPRAWEAATQLLPANTCLLVTDTRSQKQTELMRWLARTFRREGWQVLIWLPPTKRDDLYKQP